MFNYTDHLGNIRLSYTQDPVSQVLKVIEENHYYPFGLKHSGYNSDVLLYAKEVFAQGQSELFFTKIKPKQSKDLPTYNYKYNGKEWQDELGLNFYDYGARNYDPALGKWMNVDPLAEQMRRYSPYNYAFNNPMYFIDPDGMQAKYNWDTGKYMDGDKEVSFATAMAQQGLNEDGSEINNSSQTSNLDEMNNSSVLDEKNNINDNLKSLFTKSESKTKDDRTDPNSFIFKKGSNWQEAAVVGLYFNIVTIELDYKGNWVVRDMYVSFRQAILFGVPAN